MSDKVKPHPMALARIEADGCRKCWSYDQDGGLENDPDAGKWDLCDYHLGYSDAMKQSDMIDLWKKKHE